MRVPRVSQALVSLALAALALPLASCGAEADQPAGSAATPPLDETAQRVRALPPGQRDGVLLRAIRDAGQDCQQVTQSEAIDDVAGAPAYAATCDNRGLWVVAFNPGGIATVTKATNTAR